MANATIENRLGYVDKRYTQGLAAMPAAATFATNTFDVAAARTRLAAISSTTYTTSVLDKMTLNDMIYAIRLSDEATSI